MPELGLKPTNRYLPPRQPAAIGAGSRLDDAPTSGGFLDWIDRVLSR
jgi:hypothetical protein